ncbi:Synergin gamma [Orchesella cincta]|uniref:Synergin gamma n=1 Tax=Orchesella cincta TaxID=48709 RepID=A0A1D2NDS7_ORCCI|nr:Synergin gamma [Orchesella cincta]
MDEFSDFQMAVQKPSHGLITVGLPNGNSAPSGKNGTGGVRFSDSSPVHSLASHSKSDSVRSQFPKPLVPPGQKFGTNVGSRLANYDLGLSGPGQQPPVNNGYPQGHMVMELSNYPKTMMNPHPPPIRNNNQGLLIGEEDKYSALRMLIETDISSTTTTSIFENPVQGLPETLVSRPAPQSTTNINSTSTAIPDANKSDSVINANLMSALEFSNSAESPVEDFGDFQSFTGFQKSTAQSQNQINVPSFSNASLVNSFSSFNPLSPQKLEPPPMPPPTLTENGTSESDAEFGDFVSVEPVIIQQPPVPVAPFNWNRNFDLPRLTSSPPPLEKKEPRNSIDDVMDFEFESKPSVNESYQGFKPIANHQGSGSNVDFSNFIKHGSDPEPVLDCFEKSTLSLEIKSPPIIPVVPASSFIRTSLIRNDEVTDIDSIKWNQTEDSNNDSALEYSSFEKKEFCGKSKFLDVSPETRSIASLDLGSYVSVDYSETNNKSIVDPQIPTTSSSGKSSASVTPPAPLSADEPIMYDDYDKYQCFREESDNEKERYFTEWNRCLESCKALISRAFLVFNGASTSDVIKEVVSDEKGYCYVMNMLDIYRLSQRVQKSAERMGIDSKLGHISLEINNLWETLTAFLLGTCVSTEICNETSEEDCESQDSLPTCGVCLWSVNTEQSSQCLDYGGKMYHSKCANFWVNEVDAILPSLSYVSSSGNQTSKLDEANNPMMYR